MFRIVPLSIIRSFSLYTQQWYMSYSLRTGSVPSWSCSQAVSKPVWHIPLLCVHWKTPDDGQRNCPKHVEFYSKNKFEKLVHLVGFIIRVVFKLPSWFCVSIRKKGENLFVFILLLQLNLLSQKFHWNFNGRYASRLKPNGH